MAVEVADVQIASHTELLAADGTYARLMADQAFDIESTRNIDDDKPEEEEAFFDRGAKFQVDEVAQQAPTDAILRAEGLGWAETFRILMAYISPYKLKLTGSFLSGISHFSGLIGVGVISSLMVANVKARFTIAVDEEPDAPDVARQILAGLKDATANLEAWLLENAKDGEAAFAKGGAA